MLTTEGNRWSSTGEPTIYLAGDLGVALVEFGRPVTEPTRTFRQDPPRTHIRATIATNPDPRTPTTYSQCRLLALQPRGPSRVPGRSGVGQWFAET